MDLGLKGKVAMVAAASRGLGRAAAEALAREGASVYICSRTPKAMEVASEIAQATGTEVEGCVADVSTPMGRDIFCRKALDRFGKVDILVTNAGGPPAGEFLNFDDNFWYEAFDLNFMSVVGLARHVIPGMKERGWGRIITITSIAVKQPIEGLILSNAVRTGVVGLVKTLSKELAPYGVTVNNVCPGYTATERLEELSKVVAEREGIPLEKVKERWCSQIPADPKKVKKKYLFLEFVFGFYQAIKVNQKLLKLYQQEHL
jgi:3-oxoacyl-[acyl-carrier protein] reductase